MTPLFTTATTEHLFTHISHVVGISCKPDLVARFFPKGIQQDTEEARVAPTAPPTVNWRNRLRSTPRLLIAHPALRPDGSLFARTALDSLLAAGLGLRRIRGMSVQISRDVLELLVAHDLGQGFSAPVVLALDEIKFPLGLDLRERRDLAPAAPLVWQLLQVWRK